MAFYISFKIMVESWSIVFLNEVLATFFQKESDLLIDCYANS